MLPKRAVIALVTTFLGLALLLSFKTPDDASLATASTGGTGSNGGSAIVTPAPTARGGTTGGVWGATPPATPAPTTGGSAVGAGTATGPLIQTRYGDIEVQVTVSSGRITNVTAVELPTGGRSGRISQAVGPILQQEVLQAQSANIDLISGATYTSEAYAESVQGALDQLHG
jgi:uncharacterized protein with FMN-binding domain